MDEMDEMDVCCICLDKNNADSYRPYMCNHFMHLTCIQKWKKKCPLCKSDFNKSLSHIMEIKTSRFDYKIRSIGLKKPSKLGDSYEQILFYNNQWYDVEKDKYFEVFIGNKWILGTNELIRNLNENQTED